MNEIQESIIEKVKNHLNITDEIDAFGLYDMLYSSRNRSHPDLFEESLREKATEKFQEANKLLTELKVYLDNLKLNQSPRELAIYEKSFEKIINKNKILELEAKNKSLIKDAEFQKTEIKNLKNVIEKLQDTKSVDLNAEFKDIYKPKDSSFIVLGISAFLILLVNILTHIASLKKNLISIFPFQIIFLNYFLFTLLVIFIVKLYIKNLRYQNLQNKVEELKSAAKISDFYRQYKKVNKEYWGEKEYFTENDVEDFLRWNLRKRYIKSVASYIENIVHIHDKKSFNYLKDIFIYNLITKGYIRIGPAKSLDRKFNIE